MLHYSETTTTISKNDVTLCFFEVLQSVTTVTTIKLNNMQKTESKIQQEIIEHYRNSKCLKHHSPRCLIFSVPNEGKNPKEQACKIATGLMSGVSDLIVINDSGIHFIEVKDEKGTQKPKQIDFQQGIEALGYNYHLVRSLEQFKQLNL